MPIIPGSALSDTLRSHRQEIEALKIEVVKTKVPISVLQVRIADLTASVTSEIREQTLRSTRPVPLGEPHAPIIPEQGSRHTLRCYRQEIEYLKAETTALQGLISGLQTEIVDLRVVVRSGFTEQALSGTITISSLRHEVDTLKTEMASLKPQVERHQRKIGVIIKSINWEVADMAEGIESFQGFIREDNDRWIARKQKMSKAVGGLIREMHGEMARRTEDQLDEFRMKLKEESELDMKALREEVARLCGERVDAAAAEMRDAPVLARIPDGKRGMSEQLPADEA